MKEHIKFPSINQFRTTVKNVRDAANWNNAELPTLKFTGTVKLHGTNASIVKDVETQEIWCQSRETIITPDADNAGFAQFVSENMESIYSLFCVVSHIKTYTSKSKIVIFGEWCGSGVQKKVAISEVPKMFVIFGIKIVTGEKETWATKSELVRFMQLCDPIHMRDRRIFYIHHFKTWEMLIDFAHPEDVQNKLVELTDQVEKECPVGAAFGVSGTGEGIVWVCDTTWMITGYVRDPETRLMTSEIKTRVIPTTDLTFKVKGAKHSDTKVKRTATIDVEKVKSIKEFATNVTTDHRLEKMVEKLLLEGLPLEFTSIPRFLQLVSEDVIKEESDVMVESGLTHKEAMTEVSNMSREWFKRLVNNKAFEN